MSEAPVIWCVGLTTLDVIHRAAAPRTANSKVTATAQWVAAGGPAANAAVTAAALDARAVLISAIGSGPVAAAARADLDAAQVAVLDCAGPNFELAVSAVLVDAATGERSVISPDAGAHLVAGPTAAKLAALPPPAAVLFDGHHPEITSQVLAVVGSGPSAARPLVVLDGGRWRPVFAELLPMADVAALSADFSAPPDMTAQAKATVVTHGPDPVTYRSASGEAGSVSVPRVRAVDTLGAGDAFHGALTVALAQGQPLPEAIRFAIAVASLRVQNPGPRAWLAKLPALPD